VVRGVAIAGVVASVVALAAKWALKKSRKAGVDEADASDHLDLPEDNSDSIMQ
jgi:hypothetical protein